MTNKKMTVFVKAEYLIEMDKLYADIFKGDES